MATNYTQDVRDVIEYRKPLAVLEREKSPEDYNAAAHLIAQHPEHLYRITHEGTGENGKPALFLAVARTLHTLRAYQNAMRAREDTPRRIFQSTIGELLGYSAGSIAEFLETETARTCPCSLCGRDDLAHEMHARRTQFHAK